MPREIASNSFSTNTNLRLAFVDFDRDDGQISCASIEAVENAVLETLANTSTDSYIAFERGWAMGHRFVDCANRNSLNLFLEAVEKVNASGGNVSTIPWSQLKSVKGWVWVPKPYITKTMLEKFIRIQNPNYNTTMWMVVSEGEQQLDGQNFLLKIGQDHLKTLKENDMRVRVGLDVSKFVLDREEPLCI